MQPQAHGTDDTENEGLGFISPRLPVRGLELVPHFKRAMQAAAMRQPLRV